MLLRKSVYKMTPYVNPESDFWNKTANFRSQCKTCRFCLNSKLGLEDTTSLDTCTCWSVSPFYFWRALQLHWRVLQHWVSRSWLAAPTIEKMSAQWHKGRRIPELVWYLFKDQETAFTSVRQRYLTGTVSVIQLRSSLPTWATGVGSFSKPHRS